MTPLFEWYQNLNARDQKILVIAVPIIGILLLITTVIQPINKAINNKMMDVQDHKKAIVLLQEMAPQKSGGSGKQSYTSLTQVVTNTTRQMGFKLDRFEEKKTGEINVWFDRIGFDNMMAWLAKLENEYGIATSHISISQTNDMGVVRANIRLISG